MKSFFVLLTCATLAMAAPAATLVKKALLPVATINTPSATITGSGDLILESFSGIPFAQQPTGSLRLKPPASLTAALGDVTAIAQPKACPQMFFSTDTSDFPTDILGELLDLPFFQTVVDEGEDCLTLNVVRPAGTTADDSLPVLVYIFGGGFELGSTTMYQGHGQLTQAIVSGKPYIYVAMNYRVGGFGFLPGAEILADGSANLGLLDQRLALQWVADNIASFGGNPDQVTIWGESAGAISVFDQMALYDGDYTYNGSPLFRGGIMDSGAVVPANPVDGTKGQQVFDTVVETAGCSSASDKLECLRALDYETYLNAANSVPGILSYTSVALSYLPRPDGTVLTASPDVLLTENKFAKIPFIIGDQEDEGTLFALFQSNITTSDELLEYLGTVFWPFTETSVLEGLLDVYPDDPAAGSPFGTGDANQLYAEFKRLAAILGDLTFTLERRAFLQTAASLNPDIPSWSYLASYDYGTPYLGTTHGSDILQVIYGLVTDYASVAFRDYYINFVYYLDPNTDSGYPNWPQYSEAQQLLHMNASVSGLITDDFRSDAYNYLVANTQALYI